MKQEHVSILVDMGFTLTEAKVYLTLLKEGESLAGNIASCAELYRKNVYDALVSLSRKGLITHKIINGKKYWICLEPEKIKKILEEKLLKFAKFLPEFSADYNKKIEKNYIEIHEGIEGVKHTIDLMLNEKHSIFLLGATGKIFEKLEYSIENILDNLKKNNLQAHFLLNFHLKETDLEKEFFKVKKRFNKFQYRFMPKELASKTQIYIFGDYSIVFSWEEKPSSILIKNREIANGFKSYFEFLWKISN